MEKVFLRVYNREIEGMVDGGQLDEAVAHCQQILKTYPMHLETYRLLGKTFLEARRYADAADIFERVLMAVPDDFVSHVGMSIIRDDQGKLDDAIWHMERAFEVQPANSAIQGELRRLFGRRDGVEPSKIRLSRDALANMYTKGELYNQAIAEIRSVLADDQNRPDLQVMLARAYYRSSQKVEAAEIAATLLKKYPYCVDALRVLVDVLPGTARAENTQVYRHRLQLLDPYSNYAVDSAFASDQVADSAISLERLDYRPGAMPASSPPDWTSSLGLKLNEKKVEPPPEWMQTPTAAEEPAPFTPGSSEPESMPANNAAPEAIPDWMRSAGWVDSAGEAQAGSITTGEEPLGEPIEKAEIPDWLMSMAPVNVAAEDDQLSEEPVEALPMNEEGIPDWLKPIGPMDTAGQVDKQTRTTVTPQPLTSNDIPDFLKTTHQQEAGEEVPLEPQAAVESLPVIDESPWDYDEQIDTTIPASIEQAEPQKPIETQPAEDNNIPDWLQGLAPTPMAAETLLASQEESEQTQKPVESQSASQSTEADDIPDWLKSIVPPAAMDEISLEPQIPVEPQAPIEEGKPDWLDSTTPSSASGEELTEPGLPDEPNPEGLESGIPDWLGSLTPSETTGGRPEEHKLPVELEPENMESEVPDWLSALAPTHPEAPSDEDQQPPSPVEPQSEHIESGVPDWLASLTPPEPSGEKPEEPKPSVELEPEKTDIDVPDWLSASTPTPTEASPEVDQEPPLVVEPQLESSKSGIPDWLASLTPSEPSGEKPEEPKPSVELEPEKTESDVPDWLSASTPTPTEVSQEVYQETPLAVEPQSESSESGVPDWLSSLVPSEPSGEKPKEPKPSIEPQLEKTESVVPDWLSPLSPTPTEAPPEGDQEPPLLDEPQSESSESGVPDWLSSLAPSEPSSEKHEEPKPSVETQPEKIESDVPDWLSSLAPTRAEAIPEEDQVPQMPVEPQPESSTPDWHPSFGSTETSGEAQMEHQESLEVQPTGEENVPDWLKLPGQEQEEYERPSEPEAGYEQENSGEFVPVSPVEPVSEPADLPEPALPEEPGLDAAEPPHSTPPAEGAEAFPDFLTGMGARAAAAAMAASEANIQLNSSEQATAQQPVLSEPSIREPVTPQASSMTTSNESFRPSGEVKPLNIGDDAMGWLESLAAKQGAKPEELLTNPQDRSAKMPDWLREPDESEIEHPADLTPEQIRSLPETLPLEPLGRFTNTTPAVPSQSSDESGSDREEILPVEEKPEMVVPTTTPTVTSDEDTLAWLEQLSGTEESKPEEQQADLEAAQGPTLDWIQKELEKEEDKPVVIVPDETARATPELLEDEGDVTIPSWVNEKNMEETIDRKRVKEPNEVQPVTEKDELPDWLKDLEKPLRPAESPKLADDLPDWLRQPVPLDESQSGPEPVTPAWVDENIPVDEQTVPTVPEEWIPADTKPEEFPESYTGPDSILAVETTPESKPFPVSAPRPAEESFLQAESVSFSSKPPSILPTLKQTGMLSLIPAQDKDAELLSNAQTVLDQNSLDESMKLYSKLVKKGRLLDEVIHDLREAIYRYPVDVIIWQTLGDAYMRANRLQDALDAYTKAEELLR